MRARDTSREAAEQQLEVYRRMTPQARLRVGLELTELSRQLLRQGIRRRHPEYDEDQLRSAFRRAWLGPALFREVYPALPELEP